MRNDRAKLKIIFMGTPDFAVPVLTSLISSGYTLSAIFTQPDKKVGREQKLIYSPVKKLALKYKISLYQPEELNQRIEQKIRSLIPDLIVVAAYGKIIPKEILEIPKYGCLNVHASLLPKYRGASPIQAAILAGEKETGVTIMLMDEKVDHGPILAQRKEKIYNNDTGKTLHDRLSKKGAELLIEILPNWFEGKIKPQLQDHSKATYTKMLSRNDGRINWTKPADEIERQIRAYYPWPGSWTKWNGKRLKIFPDSTVSYQLSTNRKLGEVFLTKDERLAITCGKGYLVIGKLQLEGKKKMTTREFLKGYHQITGAVLE